MNARRAGATRAWIFSEAGWARRSLLGLALLGLALLALSGCSLTSGADSSGAVSGQDLSALPWCDQPLISFQDDSQPSQQALTSWSAVKDQFGFTPYLPATLPKGTCLDLVGGSIHDPIFGSHLSITWVAPKTGPISFSEAPKRGSVSAAPQCGQSQQGSAATTICIGALGDASVTIASHLPESALKAYFSALQPNASWEPGVTTTGG